MNREESPGCKDSDVLHAEDHLGAALIGHGDSVII